MLSNANTRTVDKSTGPCGRNFIEPSNAEATGEETSELEPKKAKSAPKQRKRISGNAIREPTAKKHTSVEFDDSYDWNPVDELCATLDVEPSPWETISTAQLRSGHHHSHEKSTKPGLSPASVKLRTEDAALRAQHEMQVEMLHMYREQSKVAQQHHLESLAIMEQSNNREAELQLRQHQRSMQSDLLRCRSDAFTAHQSPNENQKEMFLQAFVPSHFDDWRNYPQQCRPSSFAAAFAGSDSRLDLHSTMPQMGPSRAITDGGVA